MMNFIQIAVLAIIQGMAELLPVSSSAHVIVAEKLMGLDPTSPEMTFLLVMLHTGTMFAVLLYFRKRWIDWIARESLMALAKLLFISTACTGVLGFGLKKGIEKFILGGDQAEIEQIFGNLSFISVALFTAGLLIFISGKKAKETTTKLSLNASIGVGLVQGLCLPFRGFSRSGATISTGMFFGVSRAVCEDFSFALAVILTPPVIVKELMRLVKSHELSASLSPEHFLPGLLGMVLSFGAGLLALKWLSAWMERGKWHWFGMYCFAASALIFVLHLRGY